ncbi:MAG TPA: hypothetical protein VLB84_18975 [Bacteroidia bacterium]|nr:hypothetical protein [Bacteroidia bacterium]
MYTLSEQQIDFILNDIKTRGVEMEDLQLNLLDHICCIIECELDADGDFNQFYTCIVQRFFKKELKEIEEETILLLTFKNYFAMKKIMIITGIVSAALLLGGSFFKIMHWPGSNAALVLGVGIISMLFIPLVFILKTKDNDNTRNKLVLGLGLLTGFFLCWATLFSLMHWPNGNGMLWLIATGISAFLLIPVYFFTGIRNPDIRLNTIVTTIMLVGGTGLLFSLVNLRPSKKQLEVNMQSYIQNDELLKKMQTAFNKENTPLASDIDETAEQLKHLLIRNLIGQPVIPKDFAEKGLVGEDNRLKDGYIGYEFENGGKGIQLIAHLKDVVLKYNADQSTNNNKIPVDPFRPDYICSYVNSYSLLNYVVQIQMHLTTNEKIIAKNS